MTSLRRLVLAAAAALPLTLSSITAQASDIVDTAVSAGKFQTLLTAVEAAGLIDTLKGDGPFTIFAPTDDAFAALPDGTVEELLKPENKETLVALLTYHVVPEKLLAEDLVGQATTVTTVEGSELAVDATLGVRVDRAKVISPDLVTSNGVIHAIDSVILPN